MAIELDNVTAAVLWDLCDALDNNLDDIGVLIRRAVLALPALNQAFADAQVDVFTIDRPPLPKLRIGDKYVPPTT
jgi:hypothetical protein